MTGVRVSMAVMAHPRRLAGARQLRDEHPELDVQIALDPEPHGKPATLRTALRAWQSIRGGATHHVVVQDDAVLCKDFAQQLHDAIASNPDKPLALFTDWGSRTSHMVRLAAIMGRRWAEAVDTVAPAHSLVMPAAMARGFVDYVSEARIQYGDDAVALGDFFLSRDARVYAAVPNLVDHSCVPSLLGHDLLMGVRRSARFADDHPSPGPWEGGVLEDLAFLPHFSSRQGGPICYERDSTGFWSTQPLLAWLIGRGDTLDHLSASFSAAPSLTEVNELISQVLAFDLWLTAYAYGLCLPPGTPLADAALETFVPGVLRRVLPEAATHVVASRFAPALLEAVREGNNR